MVLCRGCGQPMLPKGAIKRDGEYDHAHGCPMIHVHVYDSDNGYQTGNFGRMGNVIFYVLRCSCGAGLKVPAKSLES